MGYVYIALTILLTAFGQLMTKWRMQHLNFELPEDTLAKVWQLFKLVFDPFIFSGFFAAFLASMTWMAALSKFELSFAYPFMSLAFVVVAVGSYFFLQEPLSTAKLVGLLLIIAGIVVASR